MEVWLYALASVLLVSLVSLVGVFTLSFNVERLQRIVFLLVSFAVGAMLGGAVIHLIPHAFHELGDRTAGLLVLAGVIVFFMLEKFLHWRHDHGVAVAAEGEVHVHEPVEPFAMMNLIGDAAHNLLDGMVIAAAYIVSIPTGIVTTVAVMLHEIPQEIGDFGVLVYGGFEPRKALLYNFVSGLAAVVGAVLSLAIGSQVEGYAAYLLPLTAGSFIYIAGSDLIPELHHHHSYPASKSVWQLVMILLGVGVMLVPALLGFDAR
jgi:zinc and cadmium transporter